MNEITLRNLTILLGSTTTVLAATIISPTLPDMAQAFQSVPNAEFLVRLTLTMPALFIAIAAPLIGLLLDRLGRKPVLIVSLFLYGLSGTAGYFLDSLTAILLTRAILGLAVAGIMSGFTTLILDYFKGEDLNKFMGYQGAFIGLGGMVFLAAAGFLAEFGWRPPFLVHLFAFVIVPGVLLFITEPQQQENLSTQATKIFLPLGKLFPIYATAFIGMVLFFIFPVFIPFRLGSGGVSNSMVGIALSVNTLSSVFIALQYNRLKSRLSFQSIFAFIFFTLSLNHFIAALTGDYWLVVLALLIGGFAVGLMPPNNSVWLAFVVPPEVRGLAVGGLTSSLFLGQFLAPIFAEPFVKRFGLSGTFAVAGGASIVLAALFLFLARNQSQASFHSSVSRQEKAIQS